jgi:hypothetical protein
MATFYRVQPAHRDPAKLVGTHNVSRLWSGGVNGDEPRAGVSCCASLADLRAYFWERGRGHGVDLDLEQMDGDVIVVLEGELSKDADHDAHHPGAPVLVHPTRIVEVLPDAITVLKLN